MKSNETNRAFDHFLPQRNALLTRGLMLASTGFLLTLLSIIEPGVIIMSQTSSWLPLVAIVITTAGILAGMDAYASRHSNDFFINLQIAALDLVTGVLLLTELSTTAEKLILLSAAYLLIKGLFRFFAAITVHLPHARAVLTGSLLSILLGTLLWQEWPFTSLWFICFCLSADIMTRGWALIRLGVWLRALHADRNPGR